MRLKKTKKESVSVELNQLVASHFLIILYAMFIKMSIDRYKEQVIEGIVETDGFKGLKAT